MKKINDLAAGISQPEIVEAYLTTLKHPMVDTVRKIRTLILGVDKNIGEGIFWNAPTFYYTGVMKPFDPKEYKRYIAGFNFYKEDMLRLVFLHGADARDKSGILEGEYKDGRRILTIASHADLKTKEAAIKDIVKQLVKGMK